MMLSPSNSGSNLAASAFTFAGGLALGAGSLYILNRNSLAPATKVNKSTKDKFSKASASSGNVLSRTAKDLPTPLSEKLDAVDAKGAGHALPQESKVDPNAAAVLGEKNTASKTGQAKLEGLVTPPGVVGVIGRPQEFDTLPRAKHIQAKINLAEQVASAASSREDAPVWVAGLPYSDSSLLSTANGQLEKVVYRSSDAVFVYEADANASLGAWMEHEAGHAKSKGWSAGQGTGRPQVFSMQTRAGAANALLGYVSGARGEGSSSASAGRGKTVSALTNATGLLNMAPALAFAPESTSDRIVLQVNTAVQAPAVLAGSEDLSLQVYSDTVSLLGAADALSAYNDNFTVVLSADRQEIVDVTAASMLASSGHVVHAFDGASAGREICAGLKPSHEKLDILARAGRPQKVERSSVVEVLKSVGIDAFSYAGAEAPKSLLILPNTSLASAAKAVLSALPAQQQASVGVLAVRIVRPWSDEALCAAIPGSVTSITVLEETVSSSSDSGLLFQDVAASVLSDAKSWVQLKSLSVPVGSKISVQHWSAIFDALVSSKSGSSSQLSWDKVQASVAKSQASSPLDILQGKPGSPRLATIFDTDASATSYVGKLISRAFNERGQSGPISAKLLERFDNFKAGGTVRDDLILTVGDKAAIAASPVDVAADAGAATLVVADPANILKALNVFENARVGATVLINSPGWEPAELEAKLRAEDKHVLAAKKARVYLIDAAAVVAKIQDATTKAAGGKNRAPELHKEVQAAVLLVAFLRAHFKASGSTLVGIAQQILGAAPLGVGGVAELVNLTERSVQLFNFSSDEWAKAEPVSEAEANAAPRPRDITFNGFSRGLSSDVLALEPAPARGTWALSAWQSLFPEAYGLEEKALRPDLPEKTWVVTVTENKRLTPLDYDRNVFHMEFSTEGTDLKYDVGEALGIHGWNDEQEVLDFIAWTGYNPDEVVSVPSATDPSRYETRTVFQVLQQKLDIFGKPGKKFYESLSKLATNADEARWLRFISSAEGSSTFKKLSELETVTYADVLKMFPSARLPFEQLMQEVEEIKPRHYSIASAQAAVGNSVHLLVVTVDWLTPSGSPRYGQCTRYLANLKVGAQVTVSLKPSVMKLPPIDSQPIIMAGLGTGAAPFRAFIQARAHQRAQGKEVGPLVYYFGSRYRASEYLYGSELEAYMQDGVLSHVGLAFSRDQKHKIYIQDKIQQDSELIATYLAPEINALRRAGGDAEIITSDQFAADDEVPEAQKGYFYLCGP